MNEIKQTSPRRPRAGSATDEQLVAAIRQGCDNAVAALVERYESLMLRSGNRQAMGDRARAERRPAGWQRLPELRVPTLIMWGAQDTWVPPEHAERFRRDIPGSRLVIYPGLGHLPMEEDPGTTARDALGFLRGEAVPGQK